MLIFDEVFVGFRLAPGGAQEYFGVRADMVTYGKTVAGGLPVGVLCGRARPDAALSRGPAGGHLLRARHLQFASLRHGRHVRVPASGSTASRCGRCIATSTRSGTRAPASSNERLGAEQLPVRVANLSSIWTVCYTQPSRYNWMFQYYSARGGLALSWVGTGRLIFSLNYTDADFAAVAERFVAAARAMQRDGWWWAEPATTNKSMRRRVLKEMLQARSPWLVGLLDQLAAQQVQRRLVVELHVVERVGDDLGQPHETRLHVLQEEQMHGAEQQRAEADDQPDLAHAAHELLAAAPGLREQAEEGRDRATAQRETAPRWRAGPPCAAGCSPP